MNQLDARRARIESFRASTAAASWTDLGYTPVTEAAITAPLAFAATTEAGNSRVYPTPDGGIQFEWSDREVAFGPDGTMGEWI